MIKNKKKIILCIKIIVTLVLLYFASLNTNIYEAKTTLSGLNFYFISIAIILSALGYVIGGVRWWVINKSLELHSNLQMNIKLFFISGFFSQFVVGGGYGGDLYRAWILAKITNRKLDSISSIFIDRLSGVIAALLTISLSFPLYYFIVDDLFSSDVASVSIISATILIVIYVIFIFNENVLDSKFSKRYFNENISNTLENFVDIFLQPKKLFPHLFLSFLGLMCYMLSLYFITLSIGIKVNVIYLYLLWPIIFLIKSFPLAIGGWGARELAMVYFLGIVGITNNDALLSSIMVGLIMIASSMVGLYLWIFSPPSTD